MLSDNMGYCRLKSSKWRVLEAIIAITHIIAQH